MTRFTTFITLMLVLSLPFLFAGDQDNLIPVEKQIIRQAQMEKAPGTFRPAEYVKKKQNLFNWLMSEAAPVSPEAVISIRVSEEDIEAIENYNCKTCGKASSANKKSRVGVVKAVDFEVDFARINPDHLQSTPDGGFVWTAAVQSPEAAALRVHFTGVNLPANASLYIYNAEGEAFGPYNPEKEQWTNTVTGPLAYVQLHVDGAISKAELKNIRFSISDIGHLGRKFLLPFLQDKQLPENVDRFESICSFNANCVEDAKCYSSGTYPAIDDARYAVGHMQWIQRPYIYICTGGLVADTDASSQIPYFLTANHCLSKDRYASGLEVYFQFWTSSCNGACYDPIGAVPRTLGASVVSTNSTGDYTLLQLSETPPAGSVYLGWTTQVVSSTDGFGLYRVSHPGGAPQAFSKHEVDADSIQCTGWPRGSWIYSKDIIGATEGGSSGSPVCNANGQIVGQLSGGCGYNVNDVCDSENNWTADGAFASYFSEVEEYLDPSGTPPVGGTKTHVSAISLSIAIKNKRYTAKAQVTVVDENGDPVANATVSGTFSGDVSGSGSATTDANGVAEVSIVKVGTISAFTFCVSNITHASMTYDSGANVVTCATY